LIAFDFMLFVLFYVTSYFVAVLNIQMTWAIQHMLAGCGQNWAIRKSAMLQNLFWIPFRCTSYCSRCFTCPTL